MGDVFSGITNADLIRRAVKNAKCGCRRKNCGHPRWVDVMDAFALGSGYAQKLCRQFGLDPDEKVNR